MNATDLADRIAQFEKMASADPDNDMAHFSLGNAYLQAGRAAEAAKCFERCVEVNGDMSKAYQLGGKAMIDAGWADRAVAFLEKGFAVAASKGDRMPQTAMAELLRSIGREPPKLAKEVDEAAARLLASGTFMCRRSGRPGTKLDKPPFRGAVGQWIFENIASETWKDWIGQGTKVINELRLDFSRERDQEIYDQHMREFLGIDADVMKELAARA
ncbi:MAG: Fe(2+)-trafficking protein [Phycisphaerae bacterium]|nr:Fe(2+)-trafficking protein [Phycisphaerae bacterium]